MRRLCGPISMPRGREKKRWTSRPGSGPLSGGLSTKIHVGCRDERLSVAVVLTAVQCHESPVFETVLAQVPPEPPLTHAMMDKGYDSKAIREQLLAHDMVPVIPPKSNRTEPIDYD